MKRDVTHWLYPTNERSRYVLNDSGDNLPVSPETLLDSIETSPSRPDQWVLTSGYRTMRQGDAVWIYAAGRQSIYAMGRAVEIYFQDRDQYWYVDLLWDVAVTASLKDSPIPRSTFHQVPQSVRRADATTARMLRSWLRTRRLEVSDPTIDEAPLSLGDARLRVNADIVRRQGQHGFRGELLGHYGGRCAVTGETAIDVLEAAHIAPYMGTHSNKPNNGLLLRSDLHTLFDRHFIGVDQGGRLVVSTALDGTSYAKLRGKQLRLPSTRQAQPSKAQLAEHLRQMSKAATTA